jgi:hypothetical protein
VAPDTYCLYPAQQKYYDSGSYTYAVILIAPSLLFLHDILTQIVIPRHKIHKPTSLLHHWSP